MSEADIHHSVCNQRPRPLGRLIEEADDELGELQQREKIALLKSDKTKRDDSLSEEWTNPWTPPKKGPKLERGIEEFIEE